MSSSYCATRRGLCAPAYAGDFVPIAIASLLLVANTFPALAQECKLSRLSDFGSVALGDRYSKIPKTFLREKDCEASKKYSEARCGWIDPRTGIDYEGWEGWIFRKQIDISPKNPRPRLPFGLTTEDRMEDVIRKIKARPDAPEFRIDEASEFIPGSITSTNCLKTDKVESALDAFFQV